MKRHYLASLKAIAIFSLLTGICYPALVTVFATLAFHEKANGSLILRDGRVIGSKLLAQKIDSAEYFHFRPSADDYGTVPSGASNLAPTSGVLRETVAKRAKDLGPGAPADLLTSSGSGLDPHVSLAGALFQVERVSMARGLTPARRESLRQLVLGKVEPKQLGILGMPRVNVMELNVLLDEKFR